MLPVLLCSALIAYSFFTSTPIDRESCDLEGEVYNKLLVNHDTWSQQIISKNGRGFLVYPNKSPSPVIMMSQGDDPAYLFVMTGRDREGRADPLGSIGEFGYIYTLGNIADFSYIYEYNIEHLDGNVYCYKLKGR